MPELPEIAFLANQLQKVLPNRTVIALNNYQEKSLNMNFSTFQESLINQTIADVTSKGKWIIIDFLSGDQMAINLGMGGEIYFNHDHEKINTKIQFDHQDYLTISFWWFGHIDFISKGKHHTIHELGYDLIREDISYDTFQNDLSKRRGAIKNVLLDQRKIAGIGNYYIHDILFLAKIHPLQKANTIKSQKIKQLYDIIIETMTKAIHKNGSFYEQDIYRNKGSYKADLVAYKEGEPCPVCETTIIKIQTSATSSYICPKCQK